MKRLVLSWLVVCLMATSFAVGLLVGYSSLHGFQIADWRLYAAGLLVILLAIYNCVLFR